MAGNLNSLYNINGCVKQCVSSVAVIFWKFNHTVCYIPLYVGLCGDDGYTITLKLLEVTYWCCVSHDHCWGCTCWCVRCTRQGSCYNSSSSPPRQCGEEHVFVCVLLLSSSRCWGQPKSGHRKCLLFIVWLTESHIISCIDGLGLAIVTFQHARGLHSVCVYWLGIQRWRDSLTEGCRHSVTPGMGNGLGTPFARN